METPTTEPTEPTEPTEQTEPPEATEPPGPATRSRWSPPAPLLALGQAATLAAVIGAVGYAVHRWAATGLPMSPLPGSPWPFIAAWTALTFLAGLLLVWATTGVDFDGRWQLILFPAIAGIRVSLAHRPDPALVYAYGLAALAVAAAGIAVWRRRRFAVRR
ncbi:hypothetical protein [Streptomyces sp. NBC_00091]|uniref:hypothetical protein n=1 Tax=Streptomyces sp. NBC_00091 TaxID=2975648 RepID=UPI00224DF96F|nr:hypothetical protein [Streptomyces sp. NBC_00091]MCX5377321.1 hypothetical protein [Streptomyces sp. NBC_00091]